MPSTDNAARRLHYWLHMVRGQVSANPDLVAHSAWCGAWQIPEDDYADAFRRGLALMNAAVETRSLAESSANPLAQYGLQTFDQIEQTTRYFALMPSVTIRQFFDGLHDDGLLGLAMLGELLGMEYPRNELDDTDRETLLAQVRKLVDDVIEDTDLPSRDQREILARLRQVEEMLIRVAVSGSEEIQRASDGLVGLLMSLHVRGYLITSHPALQNLLMFAVAVVGILNGGANYGQLADSTLGHMLGLPGGKS